MAVLFCNFNSFVMLGLDPSIFWKRHDGLRNLARAVALQLVLGDL